MSRNRADKWTILNDLDNPIGMKQKDMIVRSRYHHTPNKEHSHLFHSVLSAGRARVGTKMRMNSWSLRCHEILFTVSGAGTVEVSGRQHKIRSGELLWADSSHHAIRWPERTTPWEFFWVTVESAQLDRIAETLLSDANPVFCLPSTTTALSIFERLLQLLRVRPLNIDAELHAALSSLVALLFEARLTAESRHVRETWLTDSPSDLGAALKQMKADYRRHWRVKDLAELVGYSEPHFYRRFRQATGSAPLTWLQRERITHAKRLLVETDLSIRDVAMRVGFEDSYYFSRQFRKLVGVSPRQYRKPEQCRFR